MKEDLNARVVTCPNCNCLTIVYVEQEDGIATFQTCGRCGSKLND